MSEGILSQMKSGQIKMKPRWYFLLGSILLGIGFVGLSILLIFLVSLMSFTLRTHGPMGQLRYEQLLSGFPWWAPIVALIGLWCGAWLLKRYDFSYKKNFVAIVALFTVTVILGGFFINYTGLDTLWMKRGPMKPLYRHYDGGGMMRGPHLDVPRYLPKTAPLEKE